MKAMLTVYRCISCTLEQYISAQFLYRIETVMMLLDVFFGNILRVDTILCSILRKHGHVIFRKFYFTIPRKRLLGTAPHKKNYIVNDIS